MEYFFRFLLSLASLLFAATIVTEISLLKKKAPREVGLGCGLLAIVAMAIILVIAFIALTISGGGVR